MKKTLSVVVAVIVSISSWADLSWTYSGNLLSFDAAMQPGWIVQMYQDVNCDSVLNSIAFFSADRLIGTNVGDDVRMNGFTASLLTNSKNGFLQWGENFPSWYDLYSNNVYSVIFNGATFGSATRAVVVDAASFTLPGADPATYSLSSVNNFWIIPEPATAMLLSLGAGLAWSLRRSTRFNTSQ
jgi:hypothetical protein